MTHMDEINNFIGISVVGGLLSFAFEMIKTKLPVSPEYKRGAILLLSVALGTGYWALFNSVWYQTVIGVLASASTFYALFLKQHDA